MADLVFTHDIVLGPIQRAYPETVEKEKLAEETGLGPDDLRTTLVVLIDEGSIKETPDGWIATRGPGEQAEPLPERSPEDAAVDERVEELEREVTGESAPPEDPGAWAPTGEPSRPLWEATPVMEIRLSQAVTDALDAETLGKLVQAGIEDAAADDKEFRLTVF